jgi:hypothetical protein
MKGKRKYRIIEVLKDGEIYYKPERQESILFFKFWNNWTMYIYTKMDFAQEEIDKDVKNRNFKNKIVKELTL